MVEYSLTSLGEVFLEAIATLYIDSASIGLVKSNQQSILNYPRQFFDPSFNSQQSTVNNNSGATGIDITSGVRYILLT